MVHDGRGGHQEGVAEHDTYTCPRPRVWPNLASLPVVDASHVMFICDSHVQKLPHLTLPRQTPLPEGMAYKGQYKEHASLAGPK
jgi:hypothetical protein